MTGTLTPGVLRPLLEELRRRRPDEHLIGVQLPGAWLGGSTIQVGDAVRPIRVCPSTIDVRAAAAEQEEAGEPLVILTPLKERELGLDLTARLAGQTLLQPVLARAVMALFQAHDLDRRIAREEWLLRLLAEEYPTGGYQPAAAGSLTADRAWEEVLRHTLDLPVASPTLAELLRWAADDGHREHFQQAPAELRAGLRRRLAFQPGTALLLSIVEHAPSSVDVLAVVAVLSVLAGAADDPVALLATGRITERHLGGETLDLEMEVPPLVRAMVALAREDVRAERATSWPSRATELCAALDLSGALVLGSDLIDDAWRARLTAVGDGLLAAKDNADAAPELAERQGAVASHIRSASPDGASAVATIEAAGRLIRWLQQPVPDAAPTLSGQIVVEVGDGGWVVWARSRLVAPGAPELEPALEQIARAIDDRRAAQATTFAAAAVRWDGSARPDLFGVEHVLDQIVTPVATANPTIVIVLDGLSQGVSRELLADLSRQGWIERRPVGTARRLAALAVLPSLTTRSRTSLLTGQLNSGGQNVESHGFANHVGLRSAGVAGGPPLLLHKRELSDDGTTLNAATRAEIFGDRRVVGVVVNAIDDDLSGAVQRSSTWTLADLPLLGAMLDAARNAERVVVLLSDHGHVPERRGTVRRPGGGPGAGDRHRPVSSGPVAAGEVLADGARVLPAGEAVVMAADPAIRYTAATKPGYHGGASPEELVAPIVVLTSFDRPLDGLVEQEGDEPGWWSIESVPELETEPDLVPAARPRRRGPTPAPDQPTLEGLDFPGVTTAEQPAATPPPAWVDALLSHQEFVGARERLGRGALNDERARALLVALARHDGRLTTAALAASSGVPRARLDGALSALRPLLNIDGYPILTVDGAADLVELRINDLRQQFGLT